MLETRRNKKELLINLGSNSPYQIEAENFMVDFYANPSLLITGSSGSGKTHLLCNILKETKQNNPYVNIILLDFKNELGQLNSTYESYYDIHISDITEKTIQTLWKIFKLFLRSPNEKLPPTIIVIEEMAGLYQNLSIEYGKKASEDFKALLSSICAVGRSKGLFIIGLVQRPDTTFLNGETRSNIANKIVCSNGVSDLSLHVEMCFGSIGTTYYKSLLKARNLAFAEALVNVDCSLLEAETWYENELYSFNEDNSLNCRFVIKTSENTTLSNQYDLYNETIDEDEEIYIDYYDLLNNLQNVTNEEIH